MAERARRGGAKGARAAARAPLSARVLGAAVLLAGAVWAVVIGYAVHIQLPTNVIALPFERELRVAAVVFTPEGWAFFTKDPREPILVPYALGSDGVWRPAAVGSYGEARNFFGADRTPRAQGVEMGLLSSRLSPSFWASCDDRVETCLGRAGTWLVVSNASPRPTLCGKIALTRQEPLPWAWASARTLTTMPSTFVLVDVRC